MGDDRGDSISSEASEVLDAQDTIVAAAELGIRAGQNSISSSGSKPRDALYRAVENIGYIDEFIEVTEFIELMEFAPKGGDVEADLYADEWLVSPLAPSPEPGTPAPAPMPE